MIDMGSTRLRIAHTVGGNFLKLLGTPGGEVPDERPSDSISASNVRGPGLYALIADGTPLRTHTGR
jgi:hypothetical protein